LKQVYAMIHGKKKIKLGDMYQREVKKLHDTKCGQATGNTHKSK